MGNDPPFFPATSNPQAALPGSTEVILNGVNLRRQNQGLEPQSASGIINLGTQDNANAYFSLFNKK